MAVPAAVAAAAADQLKDWTPGAAPKEPDAPAAEPQRAEAGWSPGRSMAEFVKEVGSAGLTGLAKGAEFENAALYTIFKPFIPEGDTPGAGIARKVLGSPTDTELVKAVRERAEHPTTFAGKVLNPAAEGVGAMATMPMAGGITRNIIAGMGMGEGSEIGKRVLGGLFDYFGGEKYRGVGEATGSILGGGAGASANVTRMRAMGEAGKGVAGAVESIYPAYKSARAKQIAGDERNIFPIFADEFSGLRAQTAGIIDQFTKSNVANAIRRDINASQNAEQFVQDAKTSGIDTKPWGLAERTLVPPLTAMVRERRPGVLEESQTMAGRATAMQNSIKDAYNRLVGGPKVPATEEGIKAAGETFRGITQAKVDALANEEGQVAARFRPINPSGDFVIGEAARSIRDRLANEAFGRASAKYQLAEQLFDADGAQIAVGNIRGEGRSILADFANRVGTDRVPPSVQKMLAETGVKGEGAGLSEEGRISYAPPAADAAKEAAGKPLSLKEANDLVKVFGEEAQQARSQENWAKMQTATKLRNEVLESIDKAKVSPEAKNAYNSARENYRTDYAERFQEGLGKATGKERGGAMEGRESVASSELMNQALKSPEGMNDFAKIYGNDPQAWALAKATVAGRFRKEVLDAARTPDALERQLGAFKDKYAAALEKMPDVADSIEAAAAKTLGLKNEQAAELARYKDIMGGDVTKAVGAVQAKEMFTAVLANPDKARALIKAMPSAAPRLLQEAMQQAHPMKNGTYDPEALYKLIKAGKTDLQGPSGLEVLAEAALGKAGAKRHMDTLEAIANFTVREAATNPKYLGAGALATESPVKGATGSTMASHISAIRANVAGQVGSTYVAALGLSRFVNAKVQAAVERAKLKALYDPETAEAILEMAAKPVTDPLSMTTARKIFGNLKASDGKNLVDKMIDKGYVKAYVGRGLLYGEEQDAADKRAGSPRSTAR